MKIRQAVLDTPDRIGSALAALQGFAAAPDLVLAFGGVDYFSRGRLAESLRGVFPDAHLLGCSTAGEISGRGVADGSCTLTAISFAQTPLVAAATRLADMEDSFAAGERIGAALPIEDLRLVLVLAPGVSINGSALVDGIAAHIGAGIPITGGLAGDGGAFFKTWTLGDAGVTSDGVVAIGFYGQQLRFGHGSFGGWEPFGPARQVTRCAGNILYELDGAPALEVYKRYLGDYARDLPASGLLFPFAMLGEDFSAAGLIRTILGVNEADGSLTLAGAIQQDGYLKLMHATTDRLVGGAEAAAQAAQQMLAGEGDGLAILVSCVGRKLVMGQRVDEEVEAVGDVFRGQATLTGFYSYGEISPFAPGAACHLHNQTMTVTWLGEF